MKFSFQNSGVSQDDVTKTSQILKDYIKHLQEVITSGNYDAAESSINLSSDVELLKKVKEMTQKKVNKNLKYIVDIGIGGSNLGTKAVYDAFYGSFDMLEPERYPKMVFLDTNDPEFLGKLVKFLNVYIKNPDEVLVNAISKSGGTTETIANLEIVLQALEKKFPNAKDRLVVTTDLGSKMFNKAQEHKLAVLDMPKQVGGRYSVLSAVGLFPLAALGLNIEALLQGAKAMRDLCTKDGLDNPALVSAIILYLLKNQGKTIHDTFLFHTELESVGKWYRQLMGESIGKEHDLQNNVVHTGITPTVSLGSTDLHSVGQLYFGGPRDKSTTFVWTQKNNEDTAIPQTLQFPLVDGIAGKNASTIMAAICEGVRVAYKNEGLPYMEVVLDDISEKSIGEFFQFKMIEMMYLGKLLNVNTFDQPHVELYKVETKRILNS